MKKTTVTKRKKTCELAQRYQTALRRYLKQGPSASLQSAVSVGRQALTLGLETLDLAAFHEQALLAQVMAVPLPAVPACELKRAGRFFAEAITPLESSHRGALEANVHLNRANQSLKRRTSDLAVSNRRLQKEIARRMVVEETLMKSERHSALMAEQLRLLSRRMLSVQEEERKRISRELHDVIAQLLTGITVRLANLKQEAIAADTKDLRQQISRTQRLVEKSVDSVSRFARELRPAALDDLGLAIALHAFMKQFTETTGVRSMLKTFAGMERLSDAKRTALYRVAQEALTNVARHAQAMKAEVSIEKMPGAVLMRITDDGKAFDVEHMWKVGTTRRLGMLGMRERVEMVGGNFSVESVPGQGTTVTARIPSRKHAKTQPRA